MRLRPSLWEAICASSIILGPASSTSSDLTLLARFTKSQKRASLLISDAASSLFAALTSPSPSTPFSSLPVSTTSTSGVSPSSSARSLLEDDDDAPALGSVLVPVSKPLTPSPVPRLQPKSRPTPTPTPKPASSKSLLDDDDDWNW